MGKPAKLNNNILDNRSGESRRLGPELAQIASVGPLEHEVPLAVSGHGCDELDYVWVFQAGNILVCVDFVIPCCVKSDLLLLIVAVGAMQPFDGNVGLPTINDDMSTRQRQNQRVNSRVSHGHHSSDVQDGWRS